LCFAQGDNDEQEFAPQEVDGGLQFNARDNIPEEGFKF
jgi:hypothetical protein